MIEGVLDQPGAKGRDKCQKNSGGESQKKNFPVRFTVGKNSFKKSEIKSPARYAHVSLKIEKLKGPKLRFFKNCIYACITGVSENDNFVRS